MVDQFQGINSSGILGPSQGSKSAQGAQQTESGQSFKSLLMESIDEVNRLQSEADQAMTNLATNRTENVADVFTAVKKAELA